jgi:predicted PurR-regulated permease PerM
VNGDPSAGEADPDSAPRIAILVVDAALVLLSAWVLRGFLGALGWAVVLTIATWPLYSRFLSLFGGRYRRTAAPALFTLLIALVFIVPLGVAIVQIWREMNGVLHWIGEAEKTGAPVPGIVARLPVIGPQITDWWNGNLAAPGAITELLGHADTGRFARLTQEVGGQIARRLSFFVFTLLSLFFLFRDGAVLGRRFRLLCSRTLGPSGDHLSMLLVSAVRSTADGLVLVGLGEGAVLGVAYAAIGVPHPALLGAFTGLLAIIPFGAQVVFSIASLLLLATGSVGPAIGIFVFGWVVIGVADNFFRPVLIGGAAKLPFLGVLLGIFGGLETFGLLGLFLGPAIMAALVSLWRDWTGGAITARRRMAIGGDPAQP